MTSLETVSEEEVEAAAEIIWNDRDGKMGGVWATMSKDWTVAIQTLATARAALTAAAQVRAQAAITLKIERDQAGPHHGIPKGE